MLQSRLIFLVMIFGKYWEKLLLNGKLFVEGCGQFVEQKIEIEYVKYVN